MRTLLALTICTLTAGTVLADRPAVLDRTARSLGDARPALTSDTGDWTPTGEALRLPKADFDAPRNIAVVGETRYDYQCNGSTQMIAVSTDNVVHGAFMGGSAGTDRRVKAWCWDEGNVIGPLNVADERTGYVTVDVTGPDPTNDVAANSTVVGFHSGTMGLFGIDFDGCTMAFNNADIDVDAVWPHVAADGDYGVHAVSYNSETNDVYYAYSSDGAVLDGPMLTLTDNNQALGSIPVTSKSGTRAAVLFHEKTSVEDIPFDMGEGFIGIQIHHDIKGYVADSGAELYALASDSDADNYTNFGPGSEAPFGELGSRAYCDVDGVFDFTENEQLHMAYTGGPQWTDTLVMRYGPAVEDTLRYVYMHWDLGRGMIWHHNVDSGTWSHVWGSNSCLDDAEAVRFQKGAWRQRNDRPSLAVDPETGYLYCLWTQLADDDRALPADHGCTSPVNFAMPNADIYVSCSADNGETWGEPVNVTNTQTPDCAPGDCLSEDWSSMAEVVRDGQLHLTYVLDQDPGGVPQCEGTELLDDVYYRSIDVAEVPPHDGTPWDAVGKVGLAETVRWYGWYADAWCGETAVFDSMRWEDPVYLFNEADHDLVLDRISFHHSELDPIGPAEDLGFTEMGCEVLLDGVYTPVDQWDGVLPAWTAVKFRSILSYSGYTLYDALLGFHFVDEDHPSLYYRMEMVNALEEGDEICTGVTQIDPAELGGGGFVETLMADFGDAVGDSQAPVGFELRAPYPNPFNPTTTLEYSLERGERVELAVYNVAGQRVATLDEGFRGAGYHRATFDASGLASGVYYANLTAGGRTTTQKMVLMR